MTVRSLPNINLEAFNRLVFAYDSEDDVAYVHVDGPRPAVTEEVDDSWYLRLAEDTGDVVGMELHGLRRQFLSQPYFANVFRPSILELEAFTHVPFGSEPITAEGTVEMLPKTTHLLILMIGQAIGLLERHGADFGEDVPGVAWSN